MSDHVAIGVDIGGTKIAFALVDLHGTVLASHALPTLSLEGAGAVIDRVAAGIHTMLEQANGSVVGVGIGCPGRLNPVTGLVYGATNLGWQNVSLREEVSRRLSADVPIWIQKDADAAVLGELYFGAGIGQKSFVHLTIGTGLGGGAIVGGELLVGSHFNGMEIGHIPLSRRGRRCVCGMNGCPEIYVAGVGLLTAVSEYLPSYPDSTLANGEPTSTSAILEAARAGDRLASRVMRDEAVEALANVALFCIGVFDPALCSIGGGLAHAAREWYVEGVRREIRRRRSQFADIDIPIVQSQVSSSALGAACLVWHHRRERAT
jgi:glucokinase